MTTQVALVVDASVAFKWVLTAEELSDRAQALFEDSLRAHGAILGPPHLPSEVTNAIYQRLRRKANGITASEAEEALEQFLRLPIELVAPADLYTRAFAFARTHGLKGIYDSLYVVLAQMLETELWTDDRRLLSSVGTAAPWLRWIGDYPLDGE